MNVMSSSKTVVCLSVVVLLQLMVLAAEFGTTVYPLYTGEKVALVVAPVDPRSLFRGQYVQLRYDISQVDPAKYEGEYRKLKRGDVVYASLEEKRGLHVLSSLSSQKPTTGLFIRGRVTQRMTWQTQIPVDYGIEAFFASPNRALELEQKYTRRSSDTKAYGEVMLAPNGMAAIVDIKPIGS